MSISEEDSYRLDCIVGEIEVLKREIAELCRNLQYKHRVFFDLKCTQQNDDDNLSNNSWTSFRIDAISKEIEEIKNNISTVEKIINSDLIKIE